WVNAAGKISLAGFTYPPAPPTPVSRSKVVVVGGLVDILHAGVVVATHAQRLRHDQARPGTRARVSRDATAGLTATRLASNTGVTHLAHHTPRGGRPVAPRLERRPHRRGVGAPVKSRQGPPPPPPPPGPPKRPRPLPPPQGPPPPQELRHRLRHLATGTH